MKKYPVKKNKTRLPMLLAGIFFLIWLSAVVFAVGETFSRDQEKNETAAPGIVGEISGTVVRYPILDRNRRELAVSFPVKSVYVRPLEVEDPDAAAAYLARELAVDKKRLLRNLREERSYFWVGRRLPEEAGEKVRAANLKGVYVVDESQRYYPQEDLAAHAVGFVGEGHGLAGIEAKYDRQLQGFAGPFEQDERDVLHGPLVLTLDLRIQELLEKQLAGLVKSTSANCGCGLLLEAGTGEILALASNPTYDPNFFWDYDEKGRTNLVVAPVLPAGAFRNLFRLAAFYQERAEKEQAEEGKTAALTALKSELKLNHILESGAEGPAGLVKKGDSFISPALARLGVLDKVDDFPGFCQKLGLTGQNSPGREAGQIGLTDDPFRPTGLGLLSGLAALLNRGEAKPPHLLAGVLDEATGELRQESSRVESVVKKGTAKNIRAYLQGLPRENGGAKVLEELAPGSVGPTTTAVFKAENDGVESSGKESPPGGEISRFSTLLVAVADGKKSSPLLLLLNLEGAQVDPASKTPMAVSADKILHRSRQWASETPSVATWKPRENRWRAEWQKMQLARAGESPERAQIDRQQMPNLKGLSLRKALQMLNRYDLKIQVVGAGRVAGQEPAPGKTINGGKCRLVLAGLK